MDLENTSEHLSLSLVPQNHGKTSAEILSCTLRARNVLEAVFNSSKSTRKLSSDAEMFFSGLIVQRALFENGCRSLMLLVVPTRQDVEDMFEDQNHYIWTDETADQHLGQRLANTRDSFSRILQSILDNLDTMNQELKPLVRRLNGDGKEKFLWKLPWPNSSSNKETHLRRSLEEFGQLNDLFRCCILRAVPPRVNDLTELSQLSTLEASLRLTEVQTARDRELDTQIRCVQEGWQSLFEALSSIWPCQDRSVHSYCAYLDLDSLRDFHSGSNGHIRFRLAVSISPHEETCWIVVHSTRNESGSCQRSDKELSLGSLFRESQSCKEALSATTRDIMFSTEEKLYPSIQGSMHRNSCNKAGPSLQQSEYPDLSLTEDLCTYLQKSISNCRNSMDRKETSYLGYLSTSGIFGHLSFHAQNGENWNIGLFSLDSALQDSNSAISTDDKLRLASRLATAVLQLNTTPWLLNGWSSKDICFYQNDLYNGKADLWKPFLRRHIQGNHSEDSGYEITSLIITNSQLFFLCLVLLELAFSSPLKNLQLPEIIAKDLTVSEREYLRMTWLVETVSRELGSRYAKVVRYCFFHSVVSPELPCLQQPPKCHQISADIVNELNRCLSAWLIQPAI